MLHYGACYVGGRAFRFAVLTCVWAAVSTFFSTHVSAETLRSALRSAYRTNPTLDAERANLRATDENVPRALSNYRPRLTFSTDFGARHTNISPNGASPEGKTYPHSYTLSTRQQIFRGFRTHNAVNEAEANIRAGRESLKATEQSILFAAATAYMNVVRDQEIVRLRESNVRVLTNNLQATRERFKVRRVTRTDLAQSRARRAGAVSQLDLARANLKSSRANYQRVIGHMPGLLGGRPALPTALLPKSQRQAQDLAERGHPNVIAALYFEQAARYAVAQIMGELLPTFNLDASISRQYQPTPGTRQSDVGQVLGVVTIPLYQGGEVTARVRQAKHLHVRRIQLIHEARTQAREEAIAAWSQLVASQAQVRSDLAQAGANQIALDGVREEEKVGQRTLLDVLNAEQELVDAQVRLATTRRQVIVNAYRLVAAMGRLTAQDLKLNSPIYDAQAHYAEVRSKWWDISITHGDGRKEDFDFRSRQERRRPYKLGNHLKK